MGVLTSEREQPVVGIWPRIARSGLIPRELVLLLVIEHFN